MTIYEQYGLAIARIPDGIKTYSEDILENKKSNPSQIRILYCDRVNP